MLMSLLLACNILAVIKARTTERGTSVCSTDADLNGHILFPMDKLALVKCTIKNNHLKC